MILYCTFKVNYWNRIADDKNNKMTYKERKKTKNALHDDGSWAKENRF